MAEKERQPEEANRHLRGKKDAYAEAKETGEKQGEDLLSRIFSQKRRRGRPPGQRKKGDGYERLTT